MYLVVLVEKSDQSRVLRLLGVHDFNLKYHFEARYNLPPQPFNSRLIDLVIRAVALLGVCKHNLRLLIKLILLSLLYNFNCLP